MKQRALLISDVGYSLGLILPKDKTYFVSSV